MTRHVCADTLRVCTPRDSVARDASRARATAHERRVAPACGEDIYTGDTCPSTSFVHSIDALIPCVHSYSWNFSLQCTGQSSIMAMSLNGCFDSDFFRPMHWIESSVIHKLNHDDDVV